MDYNNNIYNHFYTQGFEKVADLYTKEAGFKENVKNMYKYIKYHTMLNSAKFTSSPAYKHLSNAILDAHESLRIGNDPLGAAVDVAWPHMTDGAKKVYDVAKSKVRPNPPPLPPPLPPPSN